MTETRRLNFSDVFLYAVSSEPTDESSFLARVDALLAGGVDAIQLRARCLDDKTLVSLGKRMKEKCDKAGALLIVNNRPDIALAVKADGVHLGHNDLPISFVRDLVGHRFIIGASTHSLPQALEAQRAGADYVSCGPIWATPTKPDYEAVGLKLIPLYNAALKVPFVAIGGVEEKNLEAVLQAGALRIAVVRALFESDNPARTARTLKTRLLSQRRAAGVPAEFFSK